ncbi:MAG: potassium transporter Kup [Myxococcales bacterium 68-20]|nr:MAG: potassium transporter Kup [Myxococcales bacterium 68-20]
MGCCVIPETRPDRHASKRLVLGALGIVFGDIGTSPLYALRECINGEHGVTPTPANVLGVLSLIVWSLTLVVTVKYLMFVMRADNHGEGGILALLALVPEKLRSDRVHMSWVTVLVIVGAALLFGDGMITPAISVLSAAEGLETEAHPLQPYGVPITCAILVGLFALQKRGTEGVGQFFGPVMFVWFATIGGLGLWHLTKNPTVLAAADPRHAVQFFVEHKIHGFKVLGAVVLAVTGAEALYADMGHFGRAPIRIAWLGLVFPSLLLVYFGMGALVLLDPAAGRTPFFSMVPHGAPTYALVGLATVATIIASQALISGSYSITHQAVQLGFFPRVLIKHTSTTTIGQIYVPFINWVVGFVCIVLVLSFRQSSRLAAAYGIAVTGTMAITSTVFFVVTHETWRWPLLKSVPLLFFFLSFDLAFLGANALKFINGGWVPVLVGACFFVTMIVWRRGRRFLADYYTQRSWRIDEFFAAIAGRGTKPVALQARTTGTGVFMTSVPNGIPPILIHHIERVRVLHERVVLLTILTTNAPFVDEHTRTDVKPLEQGFFRVVGRYGFMESPDVPKLLRDAKARGLEVDLEGVTYFLGRETILGLPSGRMHRTEETFFGFLWRNARQSGQYFKLPPQQVVEIGLQLDL